MDKSENTNAEWHGDILNRRQYALFLTRYLNSKEPPFVINLNASWGAGKTFFIENWKEEIKESHPTVLFNAWKNDYSNDPFLSVISCINKTVIPLIPKSNTTTKSINSFFSSAGRLIKQVAPILAKGAAFKLVGEGGIDELSKINAEDEATITELISSTTKNLINENNSVEQAAIDFKESLTTLINQITADSSLKPPLFVFIDELDRCKPTYAIELLERIKHLFDISNIVFVVATDTEQLSHSVKAIYGINFDAEIYLKRFFDQTYTLPLPNNIEFSKFLFRDFDTDITFLYYEIEITGEYIMHYGHDTNQYTQTNEHTLTVDNQDHTELILIFTLFSELFSLDLRSQKQCYEKLLAILSTCRKNHQIHFAYLIFLIMLESRSMLLFKEYFKYDKNESQTPRHHKVFTKYRSLFNIRIDSNLLLAENLIEFYSEYAFKSKKQLRKLMNSGSTRHPDWITSLFNNHQYIRQYKEMVLLAGSLS